MSTEIKSLGTRTLVVAPGVEAVTLVIRHEDGTTAVRVKASDLLDAIRTELGVHVIDKAELPEVTVANDDRFVEINGESYGIKGLRLSREFHEQEAREHLAILRWLDENPPIDPKFDALVELLEQHRDGTSTHLARILVDHGINPKDIS